MISESSSPRHPRTAPVELVALWRILPRVGPRRTQNKPTAADLVIHGRFTPQNHLPVLPVQIASRIDWSQRAIVLQGAVSRAVLGVVNELQTHAAVMQWDRPQMRRVCHKLSPTSLQSLIAPETKATSAANVTVQSV